MNNGGSVDYAAVLEETMRSRRCAVCGESLHHQSVPRSAFCGDKHRYRFRDARRQAENPELVREKSRRYYAANRETVLEKAAARRGRARPAEQTACSECAKPLEGRRRVVCSRLCSERRFKRLNPDGYAARERAKVLRRRARRRELRLLAPEQEAGDHGEGNDSDACEREHLVRDLSGHGAVIGGVARKVE